MYLCFTKVNIIMRLNEITMEPISKTDGFSQILIDWRVELKNVEDENHIETLFKTKSLALYRFKNFEWLNQDCYCLKQGKIYIGFLKVYKKRGITAWQVAEVALNPKYQGIGFGPFMYAKIISVTGITIKSD